MHTFKFTCKARHIPRISFWARGYPGTSRESGIPQGHPGERLTSQPGNRQRCAASTTYTTDISPHTLQEKHGGDCMRCAAMPVLAILHPIGMLIFYKTWDMVSREELTQWYSKPGPSMWSMWVLSMTSYQNILLLTIISRSWACVYIWLIKLCSRKMQQIQVQKSIPKCHNLLLLHVTLFVDGYCTFGP